MQKPFLRRGNSWTEKANFATFAKSNINVAFLGNAMDKVAFWIKLRFPYRSSSHLILDAQARHHRQPLRRSATLTF